MHAPIAPHYPQCDSLIERMIELRMELSRKPSNNQETQQKKLGNQAVGKMAKEPRGSYFGCSQEGSEKLKETGGEVKMLRGTTRSTTVRFCQEERKSFGSEQKSFEEEEKFFSSGDLEEVTCDVLPGVSAVSLSCPVFQKKHQAIRGVVCACWIYDVKIVQSSIFVWCASPFCVRAIDNNWLFYSKGLFILHQKRDDRAFWRSSQTKLTTSLIARTADRWWWEDTGRETDTSETSTAPSTSLTRTSLSCEPLPTLTTGWAFPLCWESQSSWCHQAAQPQDRRVGQHFPLATRLVFFWFGYCNWFVVETLPVMVDTLDMRSWWTWGMWRNYSIYHPV